MDLPLATPDKHQGHVSSVPKDDVVLCPSAHVAAGFTRGPAPRPGPSPHGLRGSPQTHHSALGQGHLVLRSRTWTPGLPSSQAGEWDEVIPHPGFMPLPRPEPGHLGPGEAQRERRRRWTGTVAAVGAGRGRLRGPYHGQRSLPSPLPPCRCCWGAGREVTVCLGAHGPGAGHAHNPAGKRCALEASGSPPGSEPARPLTTWMVSLQDRASPHLGNVPGERVSPWSASPSPQTTSGPHDPRWPVYSEARPPPAPSRLHGTRAAYLS